MKGPRTSLLVLFAVDASLLAPEEEEVPNWNGTNLHAIHLQLLGNFNKPFRKAYPLNGETTPATSHRQAIIELGGGNG